MKRISTTSKTFFVSSAGVKRSVQVKRDGSVTCWGSEDLGGRPLDCAGKLRQGHVLLPSIGSVPFGLCNLLLEHQLEFLARSSLLCEPDAAGVCDVCSNFGAFAATKEDGSVVAWGARAAGISRWLCSPAGMEPMSPHAARSTACAAIPPSNKKKARIVKCNTVLVHNGKSTLYVKVHLR